MQQLTILQTTYYNKLESGREKKIDLYKISFVKLHKIFSFYEKTLTNVLDVVEFNLYILTDLFYISKNPKQSQYL